MSRRTGPRQRTRDAQQLRSRLQESQPEDGVDAPATSDGVAGTQRGERRGNTGPRGALGRFRQTLRHIAWGTAFGLGSGCLFAFVRGRRPGTLYGRDPDLALGILTALTILGALGGAVSHTRRGLPLVGALVGATLATMWVFQTPRSGAVSLSPDVAIGVYVLAVVVGFFTPIFARSRTSR